ncbi:protein kinase [Schistosoma mansoni]|uniref:protein kinase n=1 Tax=Schistosoma mansoni TaxID=6183 RepID=UPI00022DCA04|nr:protein kinase [Schistosoma mansoni]|eukprot:XP_018654047.1 protein kinase [Schistosoma mansoni]
MSRLSLRRSPPHTPTLSSCNHILQNVEIGKHVGRYGPGFLWSLFEGMESNTGLKSTVFTFDKKTLDRVNKNRRRDLILETLRNDLINLNKLKHPRFVQLIHDIEETNEYLTFITEPIIGSLADMYINDQITDALRYLHSTQELMHCNINTASILLVNKSIWKLGGLNFLEKIVDTTKITPKFTGCSVKVPVFAQPDLDFIAPEAQMYNSMSPLADMFSLGMVVCAIHNQGHSLIDSEQNPNVYVKQLPEIPNNFERICERLPRTLLEPVRKMISKDVRERPTSQLFALLKVFNEPVVLSYEGLLTLSDKSLNQKKEFFGRLPKVIPLFEPTSMVILDLSDFFIHHISQDDIGNLLLPEIFVCLEPGTPKSLETVQNAISVLSKYLNNTQIVQSILPQLKEIYNRKTSNPKIRIACLECLGKLFKKLTLPTLCDDVLPFVSSIRTVDRELVLAVIDLIDRQRSVELRSQTGSKSVGGSCSDMSSSFGAPRNLPLIAMQRPTIDSELLYVDMEDSKLSRSSLAIGDHRFWNESASNPNFNYHGHSSTNSRIGPSPFYNSSPTCEDLYKMRRYSGNILTRSTDNQVNVYDNLGSLNVPRYNNGFLDPRRHSYGFTPSTSTKSLITVNVCEGPFVTPLSYRGSIRRNSGWSCGQFPTSQVIQHVATSSKLWK